MHTFAGFSVWHLVVGRVEGLFEAVQGTVIVAADLMASFVEVSIEIASISTLIRCATTICGPSTTWTSGATRA